MNLHHLLVRLARRGLITFCALFALLALLGSHTLPAYAATTPSFIRLINASPDVGTTDVFVDGAIFLENARFASVTNYLQLPSGPHNVELALIGKGVGAAVLEQKLSVQPGIAYTVAAIGTKSTGFSLRVFVDDNRMAIGKATVRVYNLSPGSGALSVTTGGNPLIDPVSYQQASNYQRLAAGLYTFTFNSSQSALALVDKVTLKTNMVTSLFLVGMLHGIPPLQVVHVQVKGLPSLLAGTGSDPNSLPISSSEFAPLAALSLGVLALAGIAVAWFTRFWPFHRQKRSTRPGRLFGAALGAILALCLSLAGLSFAAFVTHPTPAPTARLLIPAIGVNAAIESVGIRSSGAMDTPRQNPWSDVGLYTDGSHPGQQGSAVIAGHLDRPGGGPAVFWRLRELQVGDEVQVVDAQGKMLYYHVTRIAMYPLQDPPVQDIFGNTNGKFLNLTTCAGDWIPTQHQMTMRLVVYTSFGPGTVSTSTSTSTSSEPLTWPLSFSHAVPSAAPPSYSSSVAPSTLIPAPLPVAIRPTITVKLPGVSPNGLVPVQTILKQGKQSSPLSQGTSTTRSNGTSLAPLLLNKLLHQVSSPLNRAPVVNKLLHQVSSPLVQTPVVRKLLRQTSNLLTHTPIVRKLVQQVSSPLTQTPVVGKTLQQVGNSLTRTPVVSKTLHQVSSSVTRTPVGKSLQQVRNSVTRTPVVGKSIHQVRNSLTHTPTVGKSLNRVRSSLTRTPVVGKSLPQVKRPVTRTPAVGKTLHQVNSSVTRTTVAGKPKLPHKAKG